MTTTLFIGQSIINLESVDSTNSYAAKEIERTKPAEGTVIRTLFQAKGRGYGSNQWQSEEGKNLLLSVILYPSFLAPKNQFFLNQIAALGIADTIALMVDKDKVKIKWPNDVFITDKKVAGILIENSVQGNSIQHSIVGMGININQNTFDSALIRATSVLIESGKENDVDAVMKNLFANLEARYLQLKQLRLEMIEKDYMSKLYKVDEMTWFQSSGKKFKGKIAGLTADGKLLIEKNGIHEVFGFKEVEMVFD